MAERLTGKTALVTAAALDVLFNCAGFVHQNSVLTAPTRNGTSPSRSTCAPCGA
jgi:hypothetical protein